MMLSCCQNQTQQGQSVVDLENDGHQRVAVDLEQNGRAHTQRGPGLTQEQKNRAVEYHNKLRRQEGSSNMETLVCHERQSFIYISFMIKHSSSARHSCRWPVKLFHGRHHHTVSTKLFKSTTYLLPRLCRDINRT